MGGASTRTDGKGLPGRGGAAESAWTTPAQIVERLERLWDRGDLLRAAGVTFPLRINLRRPSSRQLGERFAEAQAWIRALEEGGRRNGFEVESEEIDHRQLGRNRVPVRVSIGSEADALRILGRTRDAGRYRQLAQELRERLPELEEWLARKALLVLDLADEWPRLVAVLQWFRDHPSPGVYRRQLEIEGVDTKFIESHRKVLGELLPLVLPPEHVRDASSFDLRFGLLEKPSLVRFRF
ncbi:MAG TPA: DUF3322 domain-containing protein, partial [Vulgatibacter sp.]